MLPEFSDSQPVLTQIEMLIPPASLSPDALRGVVEEFVTRDGTDHSPVERRIETVLNQLATGSVELHFDETSRTCNIVPSGTRSRGT